MAGGVIPRPPSLFQYEISAQTLHKLFDLQLDPQQTKNVLGVGQSGWTLHVVEAPGRRPKVLLYVEDLKNYGSLWELEPNKTAPTLLYNDVSAVVDWAPGEVLLFLQNKPSLELLDYDEIGQPPSMVTAQIFPLTIPQLMYQRPVLSAVRPVGDGVAVTHGTNLLVTHPVGSGASKGCTIVSTQYQASHLSGELTEVRRILGCDGSHCWMECYLRLAGGTTIQRVFVLFDYQRKVPVWMLPAPTRNFTPWEMDPTSHVLIGGLGIDLVHIADQSLTPSVRNPHVLSPAHLSIVQGGARFSMVFSIGVRPTFQTPTLFNPTPPVVVAPSPSGSRAAFERGWASYRGGPLPDEIDAMVIQVWFDQHSPFAWSELLQAIQQSEPKLLETWGLTVRGRDVYATDGFSSRPFSTEQFLKDLDRVLGAEKIKQILGD